MAIATSSLVHVLLLCTCSTFITVLTPSTNYGVAGRLVIEIFEDLIPTTARHLMNRCREGMEDTFKNTAMHKLIPDLAAFGGLSRG